MFASKSVAEHLLRGAIGITALITALLLAPSLPLLSLGLVPVALLALRGCPTCWTIGLVETLAAKVSGRPYAPACDWARCARRTQ